MGGVAVRSIGSASSEGSWDYLRTTADRRLLRRLTGAGYFSTRGDHPEIAAVYIVQLVPGVEDTDDAMKWYVRTAARALAEGRLERRRARDLKRARAAGHPTPYAHRDAEARAAGYRSLYHLRIARGWGTGHESSTTDHAAEWRNLIQTIRNERRTA